MKDQVKNPRKVQNQLRDYYSDSDLWLPSYSEWRIFKLRRLKPDGSIEWMKINDRITTESELRDYLVRFTPLDVYFSVSCFLNPELTREKTYKDEENPENILKSNHFLFSDAVIDCDHKRKQEIKTIYRYLTEQKGLPQRKVYIVFSGNGYHVNIEKWYENKDIEDPIEREKDFQKKTRTLAQELFRRGFSFDMVMHDQKKDNKEKVINSPTTDTRRVRKLPNTLTKYGKKAEVVNINDLMDYQPEQVIEQPQTFNTEHDLDEYKASL